MLMIQISHQKEQKWKYLWNENRGRKKGNFQPFIKPQRGEKGLKKISLLMIDPLLHLGYKHFK